MANLNIAIQIAANTAGAIGPIGGLKNTLSGLGDSAKSGFAGLQNIAVLAGGAALAGVTALGAALLGVGAAAFDVSSDVQTTTANLQAQLGLTTEEAEHLGQVALDVFGNNFAGSVEEAGQAVALARQQLGDLADNELQRATENAFRLQDVFGVETPESISAAKTLMENFGLTSEQAFDFIASGFQQGLDRSGDFLDTIGEYSTQFANGGADAGQFFSLLQSGLQGGMLGTDKAADAFKEFRVRIQDGSTLTAESLEMIGISADELAAGMADGSITAADAFQTVIEKLNGIDDENIRMQAGVGLLGTQFEDLGTDAALSLSLIGTSMDELEGSVGSLDAKYNTLGSVIEGFKRKALVAIEPIGGALLDIANNAMPLVNSSFEFFETNIVPAIETGAQFISLFVDKLVEGQEPIAALQSALTTAFGPEVTGQVMEMVGSVQSLIDLVTTTAAPVLDFIGQFVSWKDVLIALGVVAISIVLPALYGIVTAAAPVIAVGAALVGAVALARAAWEGDWGGIRTAVEGAWVGMQPALDQVKSVLNDFITAILPPLQLAWQTLVQVWQTEVGPALGQLWTSLQDLFEELGVGTGDTDIWSVALGALKLILGGVVLGVKALTPIIHLYSGALQLGIGYVRTFVDGLTSIKRAAEAVLSPLQTVADRIGDLINQALQMPDWLIPGSPTPFEVGLRGIGAAAREMPDLGQTLQVPSSVTGLTSVATARLSTPQSNQLANITFGPGSIVINAPGGEPGAVKQATEDGMQAVFRAVGLR